MRYIQPYKTTLLNLLCLVLLLISFSANAFKVDTHVWISQEVINDLDDNAITINLGSTPITIPVDASLANAIKQNPSMFRMGNIGPDAFPDIYTGQFVVHPGADGDPNRWETDEWLRHLLQSGPVSDQERAFIFGYVGHAAADVFAHSYVNQSSGSIFSILKQMDRGETFDEAFVEEERHIELEKYIGFYTPPIKNSNGDVLGEPEDLLNTPAAFLRDRLIFNDIAAQRNKSGGARHLSLVNDLRNSLIGLGEEELRKMDIWAVKIVVYYYTGYTISDEDAAKVADLAQKINNFVADHNGLEEAQQFKNALVNAIEQVVPLAAELEAKLDQAVVDIATIPLDLAVKEAELNALVTQTLVNASASLAQAEADLVNAAANVARVEADLATAASNVLQKQLELTQALADLANTAATIEYEVCTAVCPKFDPLCPEVCSIAFKTNPVYVTLQALVAQLEAELAVLKAAEAAKAAVVATAVAIYEEKARLEKVAADAVAEINLQIQVVTAIRDDLADALQIAYDAKRAATELATKAFLVAIGIENDLSNGAIDLVQRATSDINPVRAMLNGWISDIEEGTRQYMFASADVIKETMKNNPDPLDPLQKWWSCWGTAITGVPSPATTTLCSVESRLDELMTAIDEFERKMMDLTSITREIQEFKDKINTEVRALGKEAFLEILEKITDIDIKKVMDAFVQPASDARLNAIFGTDRSSNRQKGLLEFTDMSSLVKWEMNIEGTGGQYFDPQNYNVIYNAVLFAKLSLLDRNGLQQLAEIAGVGQSATYNGELFGPTSESNILLGAIRSIDGNHQWMQIAPPYPRRDDNFADLWWPFEREYGYGAADGLGFRLWADCNARDALFRQLFQGPLNPGIEIPETAGFPTVLTQNYSSLIYKVRLDNPFPDTFWNRDGCSTVPDGPAFADLGFYSFDNPVSASTGSSITVSGTLINYGSDITNGAVQAVFYLSSDAVYDDTDVVLSMYSTLTISAGQVHDFSHDISIPVSTLPGSYYLLAVVDPYNTVAESDDPDNLNGNNLVVGSMMDISIGADLVADSISTPASAVTGSTVTVTGSISNQGTGSTSGAAQVIFYLSSDAVYDSSDMYAGSYYNNYAMLAGQVHDYSHDINIPVSALPGSYYLLVVIDPNNNIAEMDDPDNLNGNNLAVGSMMDISSL